MRGELLDRTKKGFFILLGRLILNRFILYQQNINHEKKLNRHNFMIQLEGLIGDYQQIRIRPGKKATDIPKRLLNPEAHMKQTKLPKGKKKTMLFAKT